MMPFSYPVTNSVVAGLIFEVSCDDKPMDPKSKRNPSTPNEKQRVQQSL